MQHEPITTGIISAHGVAHPPICAPEGLNSRWPQSVNPAAHPLAASGVGSPLPYSSRAIYSRLAIVGIVASS
jgi:hypothetical protein